MPLIATHSPNHANRSAHFDRSPRRSFQSKANRGATLLDVAAGSMLLSLLLIPAVRLIGESQASSHRMERREAILFAADQILEDTKVTLSESTAFNAAMMRDQDTLQTVAGSDIPHLVSRIRVGRDADVSPALLLTIQVDVWQDSNQDRMLDPDEASQSLRTQWASP